MMQLRHIRVGYADALNGHLLWLPMSKAQASNLGRQGLPPSVWRWRKLIAMGLLMLPCGVAILILFLLHVNPQSSRFAYILQAMFTSEDGSQPWGEIGPMPPDGYTGVWYRWHSNGGLSCEEHYAGGKLDGPFNAWDRSGRKWLETSYRAGQYHGVFILSYVRGVTNQLCAYFEDQPVGRWLRFYDDGRKWEERYFSAPGVPDGLETVWNTNGGVKFSRTWRQGEPWDGLFTLHSGDNLVRNVYASGTLVSTTNLGLLPPWVPRPARAVAVKQTDQ